MHRKRMGRSWKKVSTSRLVFFSASHMLGSSEGPVCPGFTVEFWPVCTLDHPYDIIHGGTAAVWSLNLDKASQNDRSSLVDSWKTGHSDDPSIWPALKNTSRERAKVDTLVSCRFRMGEALQDRCFLTQKVAGPVLIISSAGHTGVVRRSHGGPYLGA